VILVNFLLLFPGGFLPGGLGRFTCCLLSSSLGLFSRSDRLLLTLSSCFSFTFQLLLLTPLLSSLLLFLLELYKANGFFLGFDNSLSGLLLLVLLALPGISDLLLGIDILLFTLGLSFNVCFLNTVFKGQTLLLLALLLFEELLTGLLTSLLDSKLASQTSNTRGLDSFDLGSLAWGSGLFGDLSTWSFLLIFSLSLCLSLSLLLALTLLVLLGLLLLAVEFGLLCLSFVLALLLVSGELQMVLGTGSRSLGALLSEFLALNFLHHLNYFKLLFTLSFDLCDALDTLSLYSELSFTLSRHSSDLTITLFLLLLLFMLLEDFLELLNRAAVLISELLELRSVFLLLLTLLGALVLVFLAHQLSHQLVSLNTSVIKDFLALFDDLYAALVLLELTDCQRSVAVVVPFKDIKFGILDDVLEDLLAGGLLGGQVQDIVVGSGLAHVVIRLIAEQKLHNINQLVGRH